MKKLRQFLLASPVIFGALLVLSTTAIAGEASTSLELTPAENTSQDEETAAQVTSVSQLSDVQPTDWAFQALQSLVERYGCIAGYPNGTYRGNRAMTRYEFAAGLNACLNRVNELIGTATADLVSRQDLGTLQRLQEEFSAELATLRGRVDAVEAKTAELEANQFSTTTKLSGEVVSALVDTFAGEVDGNDVSENNTTFASRVRVEFVTSFSGEDTLFTRIQINNILSPELGTPEGRLFFAGEDGTTEAFLDLLSYSTPISKQTDLVVIGNGAAADDVVNTVNLFDGDGSFGALSAFGTRNSIYFFLGGTGLGITHKFAEQVELSVAYLTPTPDDPSPGAGLFNGPYGALAQLTIKPIDRFTIGLTYINAYDLDISTGSNQANPGAFFNSNFDFDNDGVLDELDVPVASNSYGVQASFQLSDNFVLGGWFGFTNARTLSTEGGNIDRGDLEIINWAVTLGFPDLGKKGSLGGIIVGVEPRVTNSSVDQISEDEDTSFHIEGFYQYPLTDNIMITPGVIWLTAPDHNNDNDDVVIGVIRTTLSF